MTRPHAVATMAAVLACHGCSGRQVTLVGPAAAPSSGAPASSVPATAPGLFWREAFDSGELRWMTPLGHSEDVIRSIYSVRREGAVSFLHAMHDRAPGHGEAKPSALYGKRFEPDAPPLDRVRALRWKWRVTRHPSVGEDKWLDVAASVWVIVRTPSLLWGGKGLKLAWLAAPGAAGTHLMGLFQVEMRHDPPSAEWKSEEVDVCALYRKAFGPCEGERVLFVGVETDADGTSSVAEADYAGFEIELAR
jgi:hypothetical protein